MNEKTIILWATALLCVATAKATIRNDWTFESDAVGKTLDMAINSGTDASTFTPDTEGVTQTDGGGGLVCANTVSGAGNFWTDGAVLISDVVNASSPETRFLRYDLDYDFTAPENNSGTLLGLSFSDGSSSNLAGVALIYDVGTGAAPTDGIIESPMQDNLALTGRISIIAKVHLGNDTIEVWYDLAGSGTFSSSPDASSAINLSAIDELQFRATGDLIASSSNECIVVENIRTADTWEEITKPLADYSQPPELSIIGITDSLGEAMDVGQTNIISVVIENAISPAANVSSLLTHSGAPGDFTITSLNTPVALDPNRSTTNRYELIARSEGVYLFTAQAFSDETSSSTTNITIGVGERISLDSYTVINDTGGVIAGEPEPGETFDLVITSINDGSKTISGITNSLTAANPSFFPTITPITGDTYTFLEVGNTVSTTYRLTCSATTPNGPQRLYAINRTADNVWTNDFLIDIFSRSIPSVEPEALTIRVATDEIAQGAITLKNDGNVDASFNVSGSSPWISYIVTTEGDIINTDAVERVTYNPDAGTVTPLGSQPITIRADATGQPEGTTTFTQTILWSDGSSSDIDLTLIVEAANAELMVAPASLDFSGLAGFISQSNLTVRNTGNITLAYQIINFDASTNGYSWMKTPFNWVNVLQQDIHDFTFSIGTDVATSPEIPFEFGFPFYGGVYTSCVISVDGEILFNDKAIAGPYHGDLIFDDNADIRFWGDANHFAVLWENLHQKAGANDLTFQAILYKNGTILFQYDLVTDADRWPYTDIGLQYDGLATEASLISSDTATYITNYTTVTNWNGDWPTVTVTDTNVVVTYHESVEDQSIMFYPSSPIILSVDPASGRIAPGETNTIMVLGDARSVSAGGVNTLETSTQFDFLSEAPVESVYVSFTATNSVDSAFPPITQTMKALMWGTADVPDISFKVNPDGTRTVSWPPADDPLNRTYTVWYTTSLTAEWIQLAIVENLTEYTDSEHNNEPVVFYRVTVQ